MHPMRRSLLAPSISWVLSSLTEESCLQTLSPQGQLEKDREGNHANFKALTKLSKQSQCLHIRETYCYW